MSQPISRRLLAVLALLASCAAFVLVALSLFDNLGGLIVGVACLALASMAMFAALVGRGAMRWIAAAT